YQRTLAAGTYEFSIDGFGPFDPIEGYSIPASYDLTLTATEPPNEPPNDLTLSNNTIDENEPINTEIGTLTTTDPDSGDTFTYSLVAGQGDTDNSLFTIDGDVLKTNAIFDFETQDTYSIRVETTDSANNTYSEAFIINVNDIVGDDNIAPEGLQFNVSFEGNTLNLTNAWIYDDNGYQDISYVDLWVRKEGEAWQDIADITNFQPWANDNDWASINHQINFSNYEYGTYKIWARGYDKGGLESNAVSKEFEFAAANIAPEKLQFNVSIEGNTVKLTNAWIYDEDGYQDLNHVDLWVRKEGEAWQDIADITDFEPWQPNNNWASIDHEINFSDYESGSYEIWARGYDQEGLKSNVVSKDFDFLTSGNDNIVPSDTGSYFAIDAQVYTSNDTLNINNGWVRDLNGVADIQRIDFWLRKEGEDWRDIEDVSGDEITPWSQDTTWGSFDYSLGLTGLTPGSYTLWSGVQDQELANNGTWANIVQNTFEIQ
ncbi:MAG: cadherin repeat domain-containing protein, partial [Crocosphaera sp.]